MGILNLQLWDIKISCTQRGEFHEFLLRKQEHEVRKKRDPLSPTGGKPLFLELTSVCGGAGGGGTVFVYTELSGELS